MYVKATLTGKVFATSGTIRLCNSHQNIIGQLVLLFLSVETACHQTDVRSVSRRLPSCLPTLHSVAPQAPCWRSRWYSEPPAGGAGGIASTLLGVANSFSSMAQTICSSDKTFNIASAKFILDANLPCNAFITLLLVQVSY